jgi:hypothetical protein
MPKKSNYRHCYKKHLTQEDSIKIIKQLLVDNVNITASSLNRALDEFFTPRQKEIILRRIYRLELSKTEKEYYSRVIKKKLKALANSMLNKMASIIIQEY